MSRKDDYKEISVYINELEKLKDHLFHSIIVVEDYNLDEKTKEELFDSLNTRLKQLKEDLQKI